MSYVTTPTTRAYVAMQVGVEFIAILVLMTLLSYTLIKLRKKV